jgi:hypothetical protein
MRVSVPPPPTRAEESGTAVLRFGTAVGLAATGALACVIPATLRVQAALGGVLPTPLVWMALAAAALAPMIAMVVVLRAAREGLRAFGGEGAGVRAFGVGLWLTVLLVVLSVFGSVLRATTHHHALAGVTYAFGALAAAVGAALACGRVVAILRGAPVAVRRVLMVLLSAAALAALAWVGLRFVRAASHDPESGAAAATVVDVLAFMLAALFGSGRLFESRRALAIIGPPLAVFVAAVGVSTLRQPALRDAVAERAPVLAPVAKLVGKR